MPTSIHFNHIVLLNFSAPRRYNVKRTRLDLDSEGSECDSREWTASDSDDDSVDDVTISTFYVQVTPGKCSIQTFHIKVCFAAV